MFVIRELGDFLNCVVAPGVPVTSRVWLFPPYDIPKFGGNGAALEGFIKVRGRRPPREVKVSFRRDFFDRNTGSINSLVPSLSGVHQSLSGAPRKNTGDALKNVNLWISFPVSGSISTICP